jgi:hypothetical protein
MPAHERVFKVLGDGSVLIGTVIVDLRPVGATRLGADIPALVLQPHLVIDESLLALVVAAAGAGLVASSPS